MRYSSLESVKNRINRNYECIQGLENLISLKNTEEENLEAISFIGLMYSEYVTGVYSSDKLERYLTELGNTIQFVPSTKPKSNHILIVMSACGAIGGHTLLVHNWIKWDTDNHYSIVFTDREGFYIPQFLKDAVRKSNGKIMYLSGNYKKKTLELLTLSQEFQRVILFTHMHDIIPVLAYSNRNWKIPVYFYNHADFKFSFGYSIADAVLNLFIYDVDKSIIYRGINAERSLLLPFPMEKGITEKETIEDKRTTIRFTKEKYGVKENEKLIVSMGDNLKFKSVIGYEFDDYIDRVLSQITQECTFLIIGADSTEEKWIQLCKKTKGKGRALGRLPRSEALQLISAADLYISSFPMVAAGKEYAEIFRTPSLCLNIFGRGIEKKDITIADTVDELIEKTIDVIKGNGDKYLLESCTRDWTEYEWREKWKKIYRDVEKHEVHTFSPNRYIKKQELINCQLLQKMAPQGIERYIGMHHINCKLRKEIVRLNYKYNMGIEYLYEEYSEKDFKDLDRYSRLSNKHLQLYFTAIRWIEIKQEGKQIDKYLLKQGYSKVAIYGMSHMGERLIQELANTPIKVLCGIDRNANDLQAEIPVFKPDNIPQNIVDIIINTTTADNLELLKEMNVGNVKMLYLDELLEMV